VGVFLAGPLSGRLQAPRVVLRVCLQPLQSFESPESHAE
jgi:hypothetical protein